MDQLAVAHVARPDAVLERAEDQVGVAAVGGLPARRSGWRTRRGPRPARTRPRRTGCGWRRRPRAGSAPAAVKLPVDQVRRRRGLRVLPGGAAAPAAAQERALPALRRASAARPACGRPGCRRGAAAGAPGRRRRCARRLSQISWMLQNSPRSTRSRSQGCSACLHPAVVGRLGDAQGPVAGARPRSGHECSSTNLMTVAGSGRAPEAKYALAAFRISLARRSSATSCRSRRFSSAMSVRRPVVALTAVGLGLADPVAQRLVDARPTAPPAGGSPASGPTRGTTAPPARAARRGTSSVLATNTSSSPWPSDHDQKTPWKPGVAQCLAAD